FTQLVGGVEQRQRLAEAVAPGPDDCLDVTLECCPFDIGRRSAGAADNKVHAHQGTFVREIWIECRNTADERIGQIGAYLRPDLAVVAFAWHVDQHRHKAVKSVAARKHADARTFIKLKNGKRK